MDDDEEEDEERRGRGGGDQRFKIEQFLIMPALLVIRDTGDGSRERGKRGRVDGTQFLSP